jgi:hypothetical protein
MTDYKITCKEVDAPRFADWITNRQGVACWQSQYIGQHTTWSTPVVDAVGNPVKKPHWEASDTPAFIVTDPAEIEVVTYGERKRFKVSLRRSGNGLSLKLTDHSNDRLNRELEKAGEGSTYYFDYETQEAVVITPKAALTLADWINQNQTKEGTN